MTGRKRTALKITVSLIAALILAVCFTPYLPLQEGSFIYAVFTGLYECLIKYTGFFAADSIAKFTLIPFAVFVILSVVDVFVGLNFVYWFFQGSFFYGLYIVVAFLQDKPEYFKSIAILPKKNWQYIGYELIFLSLLLMAILCFRELVIAKKAENREKRKKHKKKDSSEGKKQILNPEKLTSEEALNLLNSVVVPTFKIVPNDNEVTSIGFVQTGNQENSQMTSSVNTSIFAVAMKDGDLHRQAINEEKRKDEEERNHIGEKFKLRNLRKKLQEDSDAGIELPEIDKTIDFDLSRQSTVQVEKEEVDQSFVSPVRFTYEEPAEPSDDHEDKVEDFDIKEKTPIVDEGTEGDESPEEAAEKYRKMKEESNSVSSGKDSTVDYVSGVGGLKSSRDGKYLYDSSKYKYRFPSESLLRHYETSVKKTSDLAHDLDGQTIVDTLSQFNIGTELVGIQHGPTFTLYELSLAKGIRVNSVLNLADNIAMDLAVQSVRILAPIPGKSAIGIEVPNKQRDTIGFDAMMPALKSKTLKVPMVLGRTITGDSVVIDLAGAPHLLIAGTTGSGKSVCVNSLICSILYTKTPREVRMILVDPKMVELTVYNDIPHLLTPVITDAKKAIKAMAFIVEEMERRMSMFSMIGARKIEDYNEKIKNSNYLRAQLPYIVVIIDEFADLMMVVGKELESYIKRITAMARFTGIHLVLATQRPSADVITGIIKSNIPTQIAFAVSNQINSRIILDSTGAEKLLGKGDMLYASASSRTPSRIQGAYIDPEIEDIVNFVKTQGEPDYIDEAYFEDDEDDEESEDTQALSSAGSEDMYMRAWKIVADRGEASASYLQRRLSIGYNRAANLIEQLEENGCIGPARGSKPREILRYPDSRSEMPQD